jgi:hypothetical protein
VRAALAHQHVQNVLRALRVEVGHPLPRLAHRRLAAQIVELQDQIGALVLGAHQEFSSGKFRPAGRAEEF